MAELKTTPNKKSVKTFIDSIDNDVRRKDCRIIATLMRKATSKQAKMWGDSIVGFGRYHYKYASGREGDFFLTGFSPRKNNLTIYIMPGFSDFADLVKRLGKHKHSKSCLYINNLSDIDLAVLTELVTQSIVIMREKYECQ